MISARSGLVNFFEGVVFLDGQPLARKSGTFARMRDGSTLITESGRAEVLLTPDTYLRIGEKQQHPDDLRQHFDDTQVELLSGSSVLDSSQGARGRVRQDRFQGRDDPNPETGHLPHGRGAAAAARI